jgi:hypothetical protein
VPRPSSGQPSQKKPAKALTKVAPKPARLTILDVCSDPDLFGPWFKNRQTWAAWFCFLKVLYGLPLDETELAVFRECTGRTTPSPLGYLIASLVIGRRGGKSLILALIAAYLAAFNDWSLYLTGGERGTIVVIAADRRQARSIFRYLKNMLSISLLKDLIVRETADALDLSNGVTIEIQTASSKTIRGYTLIAALCDEVAFWSTDDGGANPDKEIIAALKPAMATIPGAMLFLASSPYSRSGVLWDEYRRHYAKDDSTTLVWQAPTLTMNPSVPKSIIEEAFESDPQNASAEYGAQFRSDISAFVTREAVDAVTAPGVFEIAPMFGVDYFAFVDPSGGSSDSMTLAIAHRGIDQRAILDVVREVKPPFSPESVVSEFATALKAYSIKIVTGDRYAGLWPRERFFVHGIDYQCSEKPKSDLYRDLLPLINSNQVELLNLKTLTTQLCSLERRTARGGKDSIDHPPGGAHDDVANAVAGALVLCSTQSKRPTLMFASVETNRSAFRF